MYEDMDYQALDRLWYEKRRQRDLATGTPAFLELEGEMATIKEWMSLREAEWNTPERRAKAQVIGRVAGAAGGEK